MTLTQLNLDPENDTLPELSNLLHFGTAAESLDHIERGETIVSPAMAFPGGLVCSGHTYQACESAAVLAGYRGIMWPDMRGYWTSLKRFVTPRRALKIATVSGQLTAKPLKPATGLTTEDLWPTPVYVPPPKPTGGPRYA